MAVIVTSFPNCPKQNNGRNGSGWRQTGTTDVDRYQYGFDRASNRTWRRNVVAGSAGWDEYYLYDGLYQLDDLQRGVLNGNTPPSGITGTPKNQEDFGYDAAGNWLTYITKANGTAAPDVDIAAITLCGE